MDADEIDNAKKQFLDRYNPRQSIDVALARSIAAAAQHNPLYDPDLARFARKERIEIRRVWAAYLRLIAKQFIVSRQNDAPGSFKLVMLYLPNPAQDIVRDGH